MVVGMTHQGSRLRWQDVIPQDVEAGEWSDALAALTLACSNAALALEQFSETAPELQRLTERVRAFVGRLTVFAGPCALDSVRSLEIGMGLRMSESPLDIADTVRTRFIQPSQDAGAKRSWIFTSATLGADDRLKWFTEPCGLEEAEILKIGSPFDYAAQAGIFVPPDLPKPADPAHSGKVAEWVARMAPLIGGRTLVLTTTLRALKAVSESLQGQFSHSKSMEILVQGEKTKRELIDRFRLGEVNGVGCILVASVSFWEGVDVPGEALQMVVIDKLPFPPPNDPLVQAKTQRLEAAGRSVFNSYFIPEAAIALKQGAGRLIRRESDRGVLVVCDTRLVQMGYGKRLLAALPPMKKINSEQELIEALLRLTRPSTTDLSWP
jgi:ATP-dependent DNA helicase DinG